MGEPWDEYVPPPIPPGMVMVSVNVTKTEHVWLDEILYFQEGMISWKPLPSDSIIPKKDTSFTIKWRSGR